MVSVEKIENKARNSPGSISFVDAVKLATAYFGEPRSGSGSHVAIFTMPWQGDPRINLQNKDGQAKPYQVSQILNAIDRLKKEEL
ncbi:MAG TPA: toxin HicA [Lacisediminihabitans sp.]|uniref:toxin HicA n=1 Tax=Lacisediminihabitans sp. TaxID=2787631 RepID=UPI002EDAA98E